MPGLDLLNRVETKPEVKPRWHRTSIRVGGESKIQAALIPQKENRPVLNLFLEAEPTLVERSCSGHIRNMQVKVVQSHAFKIGSEP